MQLGELLQKSGYECSDRAIMQSVVERLITDSRLCEAGDLFIGMPGSKVDGGDYAIQALNQGAIAAIVNHQSSNPQLIFLPDIVTACADIAATFYEYPARNMKMIGVTGTNGKTTTTHLIEFLLQPQYQTGLFGTLYARWQGHTSTASHTTPFAIDLQAQLKQALNHGVNAAIMEVSSHALAQKRVWGCPFEVSVFTNLTQDHLDYHHNLEDYFAAKALLFSQDYLKGRAIINWDDAYGRRLSESCKPKNPVWTYSLVNPEADFYPEDLTYSSNGVIATLHTPLGQMALRSPLVGSFNLSNVLAAIATACDLGVSLEQIAARLPQFQNVPGRVERVQISPDQDITVVVDYAHTPDSLENLLKAMRPFTQRQLICVFGCGGDRDRTKRPIMGVIAARLADQVYVTSDNPRTEDPEQILADVVAGMSAINFSVQADRRLAIQTAIAQAQAGDTVLIAGKGHEDYQIIGTAKIHFDDREEAQNALKARLALE